MMEQTSSVAQSDASANASDAPGSVVPATESEASPAHGGIANNGDIVSSASGVNADPGSTHLAPENVSQQEIPATMAYGAGENLSGLANLSANSTQISENRVASAESMESADMHQPSDGSGICL